MMNKSLRSAILGRTAFPRCSLLLALMLLATAYAQAAQSVVVIKSKDIQPYDQALEGFEQVCTAEIAEYTLQDDRSIEREILRSVARSRTKLILAIGSPALKFAADEFRDIPIIASVVLDPAAIAGEAQTVRGATLKVPPKTQFEKLLQIAPRVKRIGVVFDPEKTGRIVEEAVRNATELGLELVSREVGSTADVAQAWREIQDHIDAIWMVPDTTTLTEESFQYMLTISQKRNVPLLAISDKYVSKGALLALAADYGDVGRQAGEMANDALRGKSLSRIRSTTVRSPKLILNLRTAELIGLSVPKDIVEKATQVYE
jgi:putative ABC transport system substrate-binding protein